MDGILPSLADSISDVFLSTSSPFPLRNELWSPNINKPTRDARSPTHILTGRHSNGHMTPASGPVVCLCYFWVQEASLHRCMCKSPWVLVPASQQGMFDSGIPASVTFTERESERCVTCVKLRSVCHLSVIIVWSEHVMGVFSRISICFFFFRLHADLNTTWLLWVSTMSLGVFSAIMAQEIECFILF